MARVTRASTCIVLDAGVLIALLESADAHHAWSERLIAAHAPVRLAASVLTFAESLVRAAAVGHASSADQALRRLGVQGISLDAEHAVALAATRAASGLKMPDAVVLFTAERMTAALATTDATLARIALQRGLAVYSPESS